MLASAPPHRPAPPWWVLAVLLSLCSTACGITVRMPGESYDGPRPKTTEDRSATASRLQRHVNHLASTVGERHTGRPAALAAAANYIEARWEKQGLTVRRHGYPVDGIDCQNLEVIVRGSAKADEIVVVGAHYDTARGTPGANDNATGVAALLELSRRLTGHRNRRTLHLVAFVNEEPPYFRTAQMGSRVYAKQLKAASKNVVAMLSLETIGYYTEADDSQHYPFPFSLFYPSRGNFVAFVGNDASVGLVEDVVGHFRAHAQFPAEGVAAPSHYQGIDWSDQQGFWLVGYPGLMVTDTAPNRYAPYHEPDDTPEKLDYDAMAIVTAGLERVVRYLLARK